MFPIKTNFCAGFFLYWCVAARTLRTNDVRAIRNDIVHTFNITPQYGILCNDKVAPCTLGNLFGGFLRLAFHDSAGNGDGNGCIDLAVKDNQGLDDAMAKLQPVYLRYSTIISRADFWVLAANTAVLYASTTPYIYVPGTQFFDINGNDLPTTTPLHLPFRYGRVDSAACNDAGALPNATFSFADMQRFFSRFDMNVYEIVAIMGAHSLGRCFLDNSGFDGGWTLTQSSFGNHYYTRMFEALFINANKSNVWTPVVNQRGPDMSKTLLLKPDVELLYHTFPSSTPSSSSSSSSSNRNPHPQSVASTAPTNPHYCSMFGAFVGHKQCPIQALTNSIVMKYISNITAFYTNFATAYQKLTEVGYNLTELDSAPFYDYPLTPPFSPSRTPSFPSH